MIKRMEAESKALRRIFGPKMEKGVGDWRQLLTSEIYNWTTIYHILLEC
jgi:hypothetical protein